MHDLTLDLRQSLGPHLAETIAQAVHKHTTTILRLHASSHISLDQLLDHIAHARELHETASHQLNTATFSQSDSLDRSIYTLVYEQIQAHVEALHEPDAPYDPEDVLTQFSLLLDRLNTLAGSAMKDLHTPTIASEAFSTAQRAELATLISSAIRTHCAETHYPEGKE